MKLLYATNNSSKIYNMKRRLKNMNMEVTTPNDLNIKLSIDEDGNTPSENALKKARAYYNATNLPTIAGDTALYICKLPQDKQPGLRVRRVSDKELNDDEMLKHYCDLLDTVGGESEAYYLTGLAIVTDNGEFTTEISEDHFILTSKVDTKHNHKGNPLDAITIDPIGKKYYSEMTDEDCINMGYSFDTKCVEFIQSNIISNNQKKEVLIWKNHSKKN